MNNITRGNNEKGSIVAFDEVRHADVDSQVLQEIIDILKHPFQTSCDYCNGLGFVRSGENCRICKGSGKVIDKIFR